MSSPYVQRTDSHGNVFYLGDLGGLMCPAFPTIPDFRKHARDVREMELNPGDVIFTGFPKSGFHWVTSVAYTLMTGQTDHYFQTGVGALMDRSPITPDTIPPPDKPRIFYTHLKFPYLPKQVSEKKVKVIYLRRNPKDTWVSLYCHISNQIGSLAYGGSWEHFFDLMITSQFFYGTWFDYVLDWERDIERETAASLSVCVCSYEDMKKDPVGQTEILDQFLGYNRGRELCEKIAKFCEFSSMKAVKDGEWKGDKVSIFKKNATGFYRKGEVGDWKNWFTVAQSERFDQEFKDRMKGSKLRYTYE
ncbi:hypothetical protein ACOMHN_020458 [Nucella lapillus]